MAIAQVANIRREIERHTDTVLAEAVGTAIATMVGECETRLLAKIAALEAAMKEFAYKGQWSEGRAYRRGNFVSLGAVWHANTDTQSRPGTDSDWTMVIAKPKDGRDGLPPPEPPAPRTVHTAERSGSPIRTVRNNNR